MTAHGPAHGAPTAAEALARLRAGNDRFVRNECQFPTVHSDMLKGLAQGQPPYATILGCSDSRVPPELLFDVDLGELFIIRVAGDVVSPEIMGTQQYAGVHLRTPLFVVLGHEGCGAVQAALAARLHGARERERIARLLENIVPGLKDVARDLEPAAQMRAAVEANVRWSLRQLRATPEVQDREAEGVMKLVGAVYDLESGQVHFLP